MSLKRFFFYKLFYSIILNELINQSSMTRVSESLLISDEKFVIKIPQFY